MDQVTRQLIYLSISKEFIDYPGGVIRVGMAPGRRTQFLPQVKISYGGKENDSGHKASQVPEHQLQAKRLHIILLLERIQFRARCGSVALIPEDQFSIAST